MDKETLSNYGWIVICVLVISVMVALATPFGSYVKTAVENTTQGLYDTSAGAINSTDLMHIAGQSFEGDSESESPTEPELATFEFGILCYGKHSTFDNSYTAEEGMTWAEWVASEYNVDGFWIDEGNVFGSLRLPTTFVDSDYAMSNQNSDYLISMTNYIFDDARVG